MEKLKGMEDYSPSSHAIRNSISGAFNTFLFAPVILAEKMFYGIENRVPFIKKLMDKGDELLNKMLGTVSINSDEFIASAVNTGVKWWAEKFGADAKAQEAYVKEQYTFDILWRDHGDEFNAKVALPAGVQRRSHLKQVEQGLSAEVKAGYAKRSWAKAKDFAKGTSIGHKHEKWMAYDYYNKFLMITEYMANRKTETHAEKANRLYHGFTHPDRLRADGVAKIWARDMGVVDDETKKAYADMVLDGWIERDKRFVEWATKKYGVPSLQAINGNSLESKERTTKIPSFKKIINAIKGERGTLSADAVSKGNLTYLR